MIILLSFILRFLCFQALQTDGKMAAAGEDKIGVTHADFIEPSTHHNDSPGTHQDGQDGSGSDDIVAALQHTGEEVGMTWRSFMAAAVSPSPDIPICGTAVVLIWDYFT